MRSGKRRSRGFVLPDGPPALSHRADQDLLAGTPIRRPLRGAYTGRGHFIFLVRQLAGPYFLLRRICLGSFEPVTTSVRYAAMAQAMVAAAMVRASFG